MATEAGPILVTLDVDWAPDWMIASAAEALVRAGVRATVFATHPSAALQTMYTDPAFEVGLHPNFLPGSSHGADPDTVMGTLRSWFPDARAVRTHSLVQSEPLLALMADRHAMAVDCSIHLPHAAYVSPHALILSDGGNELVRVPHVFQDNMHMLSGGGWAADPEWLGTPGWKVLNFHPVHLALNSATTGDYERVKAHGPVNRLIPADLPAIDRSLPGTGWFFDRMLERLAGGATATISQAVADWRAS